MFTVTCLSYKVDFVRVSSFCVQEVDKSVDCSDVVSSELRIFWEAPVQLVNPEANDSRGEDSDKAVGLGLKNKTG